MSIFRSCWIKMKCKSAEKIVNYQGWLCFESTTDFGIFNLSFPVLHFSVHVYFFFCSIFLSREKKKKIAKEDEESRTFKKYQAQEKFIFWLLIANFANFWLDDNICGQIIAHLKISAARKVHISRVSYEFCRFSAK